MKLSSTTLPWITWICIIEIIPILVSIDLVRSFTIQYTTTSPTTTRIHWHRPGVSRTLQLYPNLINTNNNKNIVLYSSFASDGSEYSNDNNNNNDIDDDEIANLKASTTNNNLYMTDNDDDSPTIELSPVPMSKNSGNRFVTFIWDQRIRSAQQKQQKLEQRNNDYVEKDPIDLHYDRIALTEEHVMYCRKANLYNDTFNTNSMVDVLWSLPILSSDLRRVIGHAMCLESTELHYVTKFLQNEPIIRMLTNADDDTDNTDVDLTNIPLYRWRHIRDYSLRIDDGRFGYPCLCLALDGQTDDDVDTIRIDYNTTQLEYLIRSQRVIAVGPLHTPTQYKDDPASVPVGDLLLFNAKDRIDAINFVEQLPYAQEGLYDTMNVHFYNQLDITGKFVSEDPLRDAPCEQMKEAMEVWGYPIQDEQTAWLNC